MRRTITLLFILFGLSAYAQVVAPVDEIKVKVFANTAIISIYDFNFNNALARQKATATMFTGKGWAAFNKALTQSQLLNTVKSHRFTVTSVATAPPRIISQGLNQGEYGWQVMMPTMVVFKNNEFQQVQYLDITLNVLWQGRLLVNEFHAKKGKAPACAQTTKGLKITPNKPLKSSGDDKKTEVTPSAS